MCEMNIRNEKKRKRFDARDCAFVALFVALMLASQVALSSIPGVELVTVLLLCFSFTFGVKRGMFTATTFSLARQIVFGVFPVVLILYLLYFNGLACIFGYFGKKMVANRKTLIWVMITACVCSVGFTCMDNLLTPLWYGYSQKATIAYFYASFSFMIPHLVCTAVSVSVLFLPIVRTLSRVCKVG